MYLFFFLLLFTRVFLVNTNGFLLFRVYVSFRLIPPKYMCCLISPLAFRVIKGYLEAGPAALGVPQLVTHLDFLCLPQKVAEKQDLQQVMWLYGEDHEITEVGTMNIFCYLINEEGNKELVTPPLDGVILPGVTRRSILDLAREWGEFQVSERRLTMGEFVKASEEGRVSFGECMWGTGEFQGLYKTGLFKRVSWNAEQWGL